MAWGGEGVGERTVAAGGGDEGEGAVHGLLMMLDRYEELIEAMDELGLADREVIAAMDELGVADRAGAEARLAELNARMDAIESAGG